MSDDSSLTVDSQLTVDSHGRLTLHADTVTTLPPAAQWSLPNATVSDASRAGPGTDYALLELLGQGGVGKVFSATQVALQRTVAAKFLKRPSEDAGLLLREAVVMGRLEHPNIVPIHTLATTEGAPFIVMKRVEGTPWDSALPARSLVENLEVLLKVCDAIAFAHAHHVIHRDIKPANVLLGAFGEVYVGDWGLAVSTVADPIVPAAVDGIGVGTPAYMAPELARGDVSALSTATDVYLLGATLCELLTGAPPHRGVSVAATVAMAALGSPPELDASVPADLAALCTKALSKDPAARPQSVKVFADALRDHLRHREAIALGAEAFATLEVLEQRVHAGRSFDEVIAVNTLFAKTRFALEQTRRMWPDAPGMVDAEQRALRAMIHFELAQKNTRTARMLSAQLPVGDPALVQRLEAAERAEAAEQERVRALEHERVANLQDVALGPKEQGALAFGVILLLGGVLVDTLEELGLLQATTLMATITYATPLLITSLYTRITGRDPDFNLANARTNSALRVEAIAGVAIWVAGWIKDAPVETVFPIHALHSAFTWLIASAVLEPRGRLVGFALLAAAANSLLFPRFMWLGGGLFGFLGFFLLARSLRRTAVENAARTER